MKMAIKNICFLFIHFLIKPAEVPLFGYIQMTLTCTLRALPHSAYNVYTIPLLSAIFSLETPEFIIVDAYPEP
jgi:hypothetical protein